MPHIIAPLPTASGALWVGLHGFALSLYPFVEGRVGADAGLSDGQWRELGAVVRRVHSSRLPPDLSRILPRETFTPSRRDLLPDLDAAVARSDLSNPAARELAAVWQARRGLIHTVVERCDALARDLRQASLPLAVCHADLHVWNVLLGNDGQLWLVDMRPCEHLTRQLRGTPRLGACCPPGGFGQAR